MKSILFLLLVIFAAQTSTANNINCQTTYRITSSLAGKIKRETELNSLAAKSAGEACIKAEAESFKAQFRETTISKKLAKLECTEKIGAISKKLQIAACD
jgi:hypothetical protein